MNVNVLNDRVICLMENGVIEVLKYCTAEGAKQAMTHYLAEAAKTSSSSSTQPSSTATSSFAERKDKKERNVSLDSNSTLGNESFSVPILLPQSDTQGGEAFVDVVKTEDLLDLNERASLECAQDASTGDLTPSISEPLDAAALLDLSASKSNRILSKREPLIAVTRETTHFELIPRVPLLKPSSFTSSFSSTPTKEDGFFSSEESTAEKLAKFSHFTKYASLHNINIALCNALCSIDPAIS